MSTSYQIHASPQIMARKTNEKKITVSNTVIPHELMLNRHETLIT